MKLIMGSKRHLVEISETMTYIPVLDTLQLILNNSIVWGEVS